MKTVFILVITSLGMFTSYSRGETGSESSVELAYNAWTNYLAREVFPATATNLFLKSFDVYENKHFHAIVENGVRALPFLVEKMPENGLLAEAFSKITKYRYAVYRTGDEPGHRTWLVEGHPEARSGSGPPDEVAILMAWWSEWRFETSILFDKWDSEYNSALARNDVVARTNAIKKIRDLGIPVLPYLVNQIERTPSYLPLVAELSEHPFPHSTRPDQIKRWWEQNKKKYVLPSKEETRKGDIPPFE